MSVHQVSKADFTFEHYNSEKGYGWYVKLYKEGYKIFKDLLDGKELYHHRKVYRLMEYDSKRHNQELKETFSKYLAEKIIL